jgi:hypothetical protein
LNKNTIFFDGIEIISFFQEKLLLFLLQIQIRICKIGEKSSTMNNLLKLFTLVGTGLIIGSMAGQFIRTERLRIDRMLGIGQSEPEGIKKGEPEISSAHQEEHENCFI